MSVIAVCSANLALAQSSSADDTQNKSDVVNLDKFEVTGSHISGIEAAGLNPVTTISRATLELKGYSDVGDALRSSSFVTGASLIPAESNTSFTPGASSINMRGLGNNNVLVLVNGRRFAPLATPGYDGLQTIFDFNSIPAAAIESIQILKDGGSAIYGSDAVSGVINLILRKNYNGLTTTIGLGNTIGNDSLEKTGSAVFGAQSKKFSITGVLDWTERNSIKDADYGFSANADLTSRGGEDLRSYSDYPGLVYVPHLRDYYVPTSAKERPTLADFVVADVSHGTYNFQSTSDMVPESRNFGVYLRPQYDFSERFYGFAEVFLRLNKAKIGAAPSPIRSFSEHGTGPNTGTLNIPVTNPNNPFGRNLEDEWYGRLIASGNRINDVTSDTNRFLAGLGGKLSTDWVWESAATYSENKVRNLNSGSAFDDRYQAALNGIVIGGQTLYANPFGPEDPRVTASYTGDDVNRANFEQRTFDANASGSLFQLPAGPLKLALGGEWRSEKMANIRSLDNITGNVIAGSEGDSTFGDRTVSAAHAELRIPILKSVQLQLAGRFEHYSDFGSTTKPKIALSYRPSSWLLLRGSFGQSFHAPDIGYLYTSQVTVFSSSPLKDPKRPNDAPRDIETRGGGNLDLQPETTDALYAGFQINPGGGLKGVELSVDWFQFKQKDLIAQLGEDFILKNEDTLPGLVVRNPPTGGSSVGVISYIKDTYLNVDRQLYRGIDMELNYTLAKTPAGRFILNLGGTYLETLRYNNTDLAGTYDYPSWRGTFTTTWELGNWSASVLLDHTGSFENYSEIGKVKRQIHVNPQVSYRGFRNIKLTLGARNVLNEDPPFDEHAYGGFNNDISNPEKAFVYLRLAKDF